MASLSGYIVFLCPRCGAVRYARAGQRTAKCFECGYKIPLSAGKTRILLRTRRVEDAMEAVKRYKEKNRFRRLF
ncbi:MAG: DUF1922 domain-containing protein [Candidatus Bathyarchaeota archaeon]|nr:DUF1922 domain-containing protein [Candidatus Bathyarchaeota archaeon]